MYKKDFPVLNNNKEWKKLIYFDSSCSYLKNKYTINGINKYYLEYSCCSWDREASFLWSKLFWEINDTRSLIKNFIWANKEDNLIFTSGTTDSINKLIFWIDEKKISTIITSDLEHNSNFLPQLEYCKQKNIKFTIFSYKDIIDPVKLDTKLSIIKWSFLFCFTHSSNIIWWRFYIEEISKIVHKYWGYILVDDAQFISYNEENVIKNNIDFLVFSAHKIWWPTWIGILYIKKWKNEIIKYSNKVWWGTIVNINNFKPNYKKNMDFYEWWVQDFAWILWFWECIKYYKKIWYKEINTHIISLYQYFIKKYNNLNLNSEFNIISTKQSWLITLIPKNINVIDFNSYCNYFLEDYIISFRTWSVCADNYVNTYLNWNNNIIRISFWIYNTKDDIDIFINTLIKYLNIT